MTLDFITKEDLEKFKDDFLKEMQSLLSGQNSNKVWLKTNEVREILKCSHSTVQTLRITGKLPYTEILGTKYYSIEDVQNLFEQNKKQNRRADICI